VVAAIKGRCLIGGEWREADGEQMRSTDPAETRTLWEGRAAGPATVSAAVEAASRVAPTWAALSREARVEHLERVIAVIDDRGDELAAAISAEVGKPGWEGKTEVASVRGKLAASIAAYGERATGATRQAGAASAVTFFRPLGVVAVLGPFNFPAHMPNGHIMPALLAGNTVVFKPSDLTPLAGEIYASLWSDAGLPPGVVNLVQGGGETGASLVGHHEVAGVFFNGSRATGVAISRAVADRPEKLLVLEMGGSNPLVVWDYDDLAAAVCIAVQSCYVTAGQRCTAARRLIVRDEDGELLDALGQTLRVVRVAAPDADPAPFIGPVVSKDAARRLLGEQSALIQRGGVPIVEMAPTGDGLPYLQPGLIDMTSAKDVPDEEIFGPLLQVQRIGSFEEALAVANSSRFALAAGIVCRERERFDEFAANTRTGIVNWNQQLTGASGLAPFGGLGESGNHRPSGFMAVDYCSDAVGSLQSPSASLPEQLPPGLTVRT
jgi:succinylglutamic semialdehyde dehydrogenase